MEVKELQAVHHAFLLQELHAFHHFEGGETELRAGTAAVYPFSGAFVLELGAETDAGLDIELSGDVEQERELLKAVNHDEDVAAEARSKKGRLDILFVLEAVTDEQGLGVVEKGEGHEQLGLGAGFEAKAGFGSHFDHRFHEVALLVHLNGVNTLVLALVAKSMEGAVEAFGQHLHAGFHDIGKSDPKWSAEAAVYEIVHELVKVEGRARGTLRRYLDSAGFVDVQKTRAPARHVIKRLALFYAPGFQRIRYVPHRLIYSLSRLIVGAAA